MLLENINPPKNKKSLPNNDGDDQRISEMAMPVRSFDNWLYRPISGYALNGMTVDPRVIIASRMDYMFGTLSTSPTFSSLQRQCPDMASVQVGFRTLEKAAAVFSPVFNSIALDYQPVEWQQFGRRVNEYISNLAHEYRHFWQSVFANRPKSRNAISSLVESFLNEADAVAFQASVCWELGKLGIPQIWHTFEQQKPSCALAYESAIKQQSFAEFDGSAQNAVFEAWLENSGLINFYTQYLVDQMNEKVAERLAKTEIKSEFARNYDAASTEMVVYDGEYDPEFSENFDDEERPKTRKKKFTGSLHEGGIMGFAFDENDRKFWISRPDYLKKLDFTEKRIEYFLSKIDGKVWRALQEAARQYALHVMSRPAP